MKPTNRLQEIRRWPWLLLAFTIVTMVLAACSPSQPQIQIETVTFDFGDVVNGDIVTRDISVTNSGAAPLVIESVSTTCGCTTATLDPMTLEPGEHGTLHIEFDSGAHGPDLNGAVTRQIYLANNDPELPDARIDFTANVLLADEPISTG